MTGVLKKKKKTEGEREREKEEGGKKKEKSEIRKIHRHKCFGGKGALRENSNVFSVLCG